MKLNISAIGYQVETLPGWAAQEAKLQDALAGADLAVLPEYAGMEAALMGASGALSAAEWLVRAAEVAADWQAQLVHLAKLHRCWITGGTIPFQSAHGIVNRGFFVTPWGDVHSQDKLILTPYERELGIVPGAGLTVIDTVFGRFGMLICYDSEFPHLARQLAAANVDLILVPSCTDTEAGQSRVRISCMARALESQCLVVQAPLQGEVPTCEIIDKSVGQVGAFVPPDLGLPSDGVLTQAAANGPMAHRFEADLMQICAPQRSGHVRNRDHWPEQFERDTQVRVLNC